MWPFLLSLLLFHGGGCWSIVGVQEVRDIFPGPDAATTVSFGAGYNAISLSRTGSYALKEPLGRPSHDAGAEPGKGFVTQTFRINHFPNREELLEFYMDDNSIVSAGDGLRGSTTSDFFRIVSAENVTSLDSLLVVDIDLVTDSQSVEGPVELLESAQAMMDRNQTEFIGRYGTHYLRTVVRGGKLILMVKVRSHSSVGKAQLDKEMQGLAGTLSLKDDTEFRRKMKKLETLGTLAWILYTLGGTQPPSETLTLLETVNYALNFPSQVLQQDEIRELRYLGYWLIPAVPWSFSRTVSSYQRGTVTIVESLAELKELESEMSDMKNLRFDELSWISSNAWKEIGDVQEETKGKRRKLGSQFTSDNIHQFHDLGREFKGEASKLENDLSVIVEKEKTYVLGEEVHLFNPRKSVYIGNRNYQYYVQVSATQPVQYTLKPVDPAVHHRQSTLRYRSTVVKIQSPRFPGEVVCLGANYYTPFWRSESSYYYNRDQCSWRVKHASNPYKTNLEFGDMFILSNVYWPNFVFGVDTSGQWALAVPESGQSSGTTLWTLKKL